MKTHDAHIYIYKREILAHKSFDHHHHHHANGITVNKQTSYMLTVKREVDQLLRNR